MPERQAISIQPIKHVDEHQERARLPLSSLYKQSEPAQAGSVRGYCTITIGLCSEAGTTTKNQKKDYLRLIKMPPKKAA